MQIAKDVYKISGEANVYLITGHNPIVIDTGFPEEKEMIKSKIEKIIPLEKVSTVLLTHLHYDHSGNIELFKNAKIYASKEEIEDFKKNPNYFFFNLKPHARLKHLAKLPRVVKSLKAIITPGHTRGSVAFIDEERRLLFSGDTLFNNGIGRTDFPNSVPEKMQESVMRLVKFLRKKKLKLCPGHDY